MSNRSTHRSKLIAANWKMNLTKETATLLIKEILSGLSATNINNKEILGFSWSKSLETEIELLKKGSNLAGSKFRANVFYKMSVVKQTAHDTMGHLIADSLKREHMKIVRERSP
jgi:ubiquinone biosynthesis protein Coq4